MFQLFKFFFKTVTLYNDLFTDSEYKILFQNRSMHFCVIKDQRPKVRLRVAQALESWTCAQTTLFKPRVPQKYFTHLWPRFTILFLKGMVLYHLPQNRTFILNSLNEN